MSSRRLFAVMALVLVGCGTATPTTPTTPTAPAAPTSSPIPDLSTPSADIPTLDETTCPADVASELPRNQDLWCGFLTVPENRATASDRTVKLFVTRTSPNDVRAEDPMLLLGADLGYSPIPGVEYAWRPHPHGDGVLAQRVGREAISLDLRGVGHSEPRLACENIDNLRLTAPGTSTGDPNFIQVLLDEVQACRDDAAREGIDLSAYNIAEMAADVEDLRIALGIDQWNLEALDDSSGVAYEVLRRYPSGLRTVVLDVPSPPDSDRFSTTITGMRYSLDNVIDECNAQPPCGTIYPDMPGKLNEIFTSLRAEPAVIDPGPDQYVMSDTTIVRMLMEGLAEPSDLPSAIYRVAEDGPAYLADGLKEDPVLAHGYTWAGMDAPHLMYGAFYSTVCHDELPFVDRERVAELAGDEPWLVDAYVNSPFEQICEIWNVGSTAEDPHRPVSSDVPVLVLGTPYSPHSALPLLSEELTGLTNATVINIHDGNMNVLSDNQCGIAIRNEWLDSPDDSPENGCEDVPTQF
jgi:pimeloyl-ACP methyl ester carboxylesterase